MSALCYCMYYAFVCVCVCVLVWFTGLPTSFVATYGDIVHHNHIHVLSAAHTQLLVPVTRVPEWPKAVAVYSDISLCIHTTHLKWRPNFINKVIFLRSWLTYQWQGIPVACTQRRHLGSSKMSHTHHSTSLPHTPPPSPQWVPGHQLDGHRHWYRRLCKMAGIKYTLYNNHHLPHALRE